MTKVDPDAAARLALAMASREALAEVNAVEREEWSPGEMGYRRLLRDIEREKPKERVAWTESIVVWRGIAAAAMIALAVVSLWRVDGVRDGGQVSGQDGYELATSGGDARAIAQIAFSPNATEAEIRELLLETGAILVDGPSALGIYRVAFESADALDAGVARMKIAAAVESVSAE